MRRQFRKTEMFAVLSNLRVLNFSVHSLFFSESFLYILVMFTVSRISKKTFFAAAALGLATAIPAFSVEPSVSKGPGFVEYNLDGGYVFEAKTELVSESYIPVGGTFGRFVLTTSGYLDFTKSGEGDLLAYGGVDGAVLYNLHYAWYDQNNSNAGLAEYTVKRSTRTGAVVEDENNYIPSWGSGSDSESMLKWKSGEVRVEGGILELTGYINSWFDFGTVFNEYYEKRGYGTLNGKMTGATRVTVDSGAVLDLSGNNNGNRDDTFGYMVSRNYKTVFQFLHNLQAGDYGNAQTSELRLGSSPSLHVNIHVDGWSENTRSARGNGTYLDNALAFGGSIGVLKGSAAVYKTGAGDLALLNNSAGFTGELYAAGGELTLSGNSSAGLGVYEFKDWQGNVAWKAKISSSFASAESVNIAGTYRNNGENGESRQGSAVRYHEHAVVAVADNDTETDHYAIKESYFTTPEAGTLVIAENQQIRNFQSYFNGGHAVDSGTTAHAAVQAAGNIGVEYGRNGITASSVVATAPIIAGTGTGSSLVIPGGNYRLGGSGEWELQTNPETGEMIGGVLLVTQDAGMGGIYEGSIVGCRVTVYDRAEFNENTENQAGTPSAGTSSERLSKVKVTESGLKAALVEIYGDDSMYGELKVSTKDGSFALDNEVAWAVVNYYKAKTANSKTDASGKPEESFYIDYQADAGVTGGILALDGAGDLALLLEQSNFSGINIAETRTGKTVVNVATLNVLSGSVSSLGGSISVVSTQKDTLKTKLSFAKDSRLVFTTGETISTVVRNANSKAAWDVITPGGNTILVGDVRKSVIAFALIQDEVYGNVYVERGVDLDLAGTESVFPNAESLTLWRGKTRDDIAAPSLTLKGDPNNPDATYVQVINNLTGDAFSMIDLGSGVFVANITENKEDAYSGLVHGTFSGIIRGEGSLVKGGAATLTLGGGVRNIYTGTTEVGAGTLNVSKANGLTQSSALVLNAGTTVTMVGGQELRNLFGASGTSVTVGTTGADGKLTAGALTVGSNAKIVDADNRPLLANTLGTSEKGTYNLDNSFVRFDGNYDKEGNPVTVNKAASGSLSQADATRVYLTATAKLAYSGFDATVLKDFVGEKNYDGNELLTDAMYEQVLAYAKNQNSTVPVDVIVAGESVVTLSSTGLLGELSEVYGTLETKKFYLDNIGKASGYYDPRGLLRSFFPSEADYNRYIAANGLEVPSGGETPIQQKNTNVARFEKIVACYETLSAEKQNADLVSAFSSEAAVRAKFRADFGSVKNLGGTSLEESLGGDYADDLNTVIADYGIALEACERIKAKLNEVLTPAEKDALELELETLEDSIYADNGLLDTIVGFYQDLDDRKSEIELKSKFNGIAIAGAFAGDVTVGGELVSSDWIRDLAYAGVLTVSSLTKVGDNTLTLTGTLSAEKLLVDAGTLAVNLSSLPTSLIGGISVAGDANLTVNVANIGTPEIFDYTVSGYGNFVKAGEGTLVLPDSVVYTGTTTVAGGVLQMSLRAPQLTEGGTFIASQGNIYITGDGAGLVLDQPDDLSWARSLISGANDVSVQKIGKGALEISEDVELSGDNASLTVSEGALELSGKTIIGNNALFTIERGATLAVAELSGVNASSVAVRGSGEFQIDASAGASVGLTGAGIRAKTPVPANGQGLTWDAFYGTVSVNSGTLELGGESLFDYARGVVVSSGATLSVVANSVQTLNTVGGSGTLDLAGTLALANNGGTRIAWDWTSTKSYIFDEGKVLDAPTFSGTVSGLGRLSVSGRGLMGFTGDLKANVSVIGGGQLLLNADKADALQDFDGGKGISVGGKATFCKDAQGLRIVVPAGDVFSSSTAAKNYSSGITSELPAGAFYGNSGYVPRTFTASYVDASGKKVAVSADAVVVDAATGKLIDRTSRREVALSVTEWDFVENGELSVNWTVFDKDGKVVDLSKTPDAIVWDAGTRTFVLGSYKYEDENKQEQTANYTGGFRWLAEKENEDGSVSLVFADISESFAETLTSELILSVDAATAPKDGITLNSNLLTFSEGGMLGKVGDGLLSVAGSDVGTATACGGINVYEGELKLTGGKWLLGADNAARVALGATLTVELDGSNTPDFTSVYGSGTLNLTTDKSASLAISNSSDGLSVLPVYSADGKFFNGIMSFDGAFEVSISDVEMSSVNTTEEVSLTLSEGTKFIQTQNSEILGELKIAGSVIVEGATTASGYATGADARRLTVGTYALDGEKASLTLKNVGFGYIADSATPMKVVIDSGSVANTFYFSRESTGALNPDSFIGLMSNSKPGSGGTEPKLKSLSMILSGENASEWNISGRDLSGNLGNSEDAATKDGVFGISDAVYSWLKYRNGEFNIGVESGVLKITDLDAFTGTTANGVDINLLTLRSNVGNTSGTLNIAGASSTGTGTRINAVSGMSELSETITGSGSVKFSDATGTLVTAKQTYLGQTTISGKAYFTGAGEENHSSSVTVKSGGEIGGGLNLVGRNVSAAGTITRNMSDTGAAGTATLKVELSDPRLPKTVTLQVEIDSIGNVSTPKIYADSALADTYGISVEVAKDQMTPSGYAAVKDGKLEVKITDKAYGADGETYSVFLPVDVDAFPSKANTTVAYSAVALPVATAFDLQSGAKWTANLAAGDGVSATVAKLDGTIQLEGLDDAGVLGKNVVLVAADDISAGTKSGSEAVATALRKGILSENVMVYTDANGNVSVRVLNDDFAIAGVDYNEGVSDSFLGALSVLAGSADAEQGVLNADTVVAGQGKELLFALNSLTAAQLAQEVDKLSPNGFASMLAMPATAFNSDAARIHERLNQRRYDGADPLRDSGEYEFFVLAQSDFAENGSASDSPIYDYNLYGMTAGYDWKPSYETTLGFALGYTYGDAKMHNGGGKVEMDDMRVTAFASRLFGTFYLDAGVQAGMASFDTRRNTVAGAAKGDTDALFAGTFVTLGSVFSLWQNKKDGSGLYFTPSIGLSYFHTEIDGFSESGTAGLNVDDTDGDSLRARIAGALQWEFPLETWKMRLGLEVAYTHDFLGEELDLEGRFTAGGPKFSTSAQALPTDIFSVGPTLDIMVSEKTSLYFGYGVEIDTDSGVSQNVNAGFRHRF